MTEPVPVSHPENVSVNNPSIEELRGLFPRTSDFRFADIIIAVKWLGLVPIVIRPSKFGRDVLLLFTPGNPLITYSYDFDACNFCAYRNGIDASDGTADPLPHWSTDSAEAISLVEELRSMAVYMQITAVAESKACWSARLYSAKQLGWSQPSTADSLSYAVSRALLLADSGVYRP